jgi:hypothetical protein
MKLLRLALLATTIIFAAAPAYAQEEQHEIKMQVIVSGDGSDSENVINWTSNDPNIDLQNMQIGESQAIVDESGRSVLVTKEADGLRFDVDGESVVIPDMGAMHGSTMTLVSADGMTTMDHDIDVQVVGGGHAMASPVTEGVMIITKEPLDATTQESIRSLLLSIGNDDEVTFIDGSGGPNRHVKVIRKTVELKN